MVNLLLMRVVFSVLHNEDYGQSGGSHIRFTSLSFIDLKAVSFFCVECQYCIEMFITHIYNMLIFFNCPSFSSIS